jgi:hypothetical protein
MADENLKINCTFSQSLTLESRRFSLKFSRFTKNYEKRVSRIIIVLPVYGLVSQNSYNLNVKNPRRLYTWNEGDIFVAAGGREIAQPGKEVKVRP